MRITLWIKGHRLGKKVWQRKHGVNICFGFWVFYFLCVFLLWGLKFKYCCTWKQNHAEVFTPEWRKRMLQSKARKKWAMEKSGNLIANGRKGLETRASICKACGKEGLGRNIKKHIEANHLKGIFSHPCNLCQKICRSRDGLWQHKRTNHKNVLWSSIYIPYRILIFFSYAIVFPNAAPYGYPC